MGNKKKGNILFDVTMGAYDGARVCELVGCFILSDLASKYNKKDICLYRDDGLAELKTFPAHRANQSRRSFQKVFRLGNSHSVQLEGSLR